MFLSQLYSTADAATSHTASKAAPSAEPRVEAEATALSRFQEGDADWLMGKPRPLTLPTVGKLLPGLEDGKIEVMLPDDRCKAGVIQFGTFECKVLGKTGRSLHPCPSPKKLIPTTLMDDNKGDTPLGEWDVSARALDGTEKKRWGKTPLKMIRIPPMKTERGGERDAFLIHSNTDAEKRKENIGLEPGAKAPKNNVTGTAGCLKVHTSCLAAIDKYLIKSGGALKMTIQDERGNTDPKKTKRIKK